MEVLFTLEMKKNFNTARNTNLTPYQKVDINIDNQLGKGFRHCKKTLQKPFHLKSNY